MKFDSFAMVYDLLPGMSMKTLHPRAFYIENTEAGPCLVRFLCPCGCGSELDLPLEGGPPRPGRDTWQLERHSGAYVSLTPSVHIQGACGAHFNLKNNEIEWCT